MNRKQRFAQNMLELSNKSQVRNIAFYCEKSMPYLYSAVVMVLCEKYGWDVEQLEKFVGEVEEVWWNFADNKITENIPSICFEKTGIALMDIEEANEKGYVNGQEILHP